jgi:RNA polymerase sigma-70 factor, ECF subfamily
MALLFVRLVELSGRPPVLRRWELSELETERLQKVRDEMVAFLPRLRRFCLTLTHSPDGADDLAQSTVLRALDRIEQWEAGTRLDSWMYRIARNIHIDAIRAGKTRGTAVDIEALDNVTGDDGRRVVEGRSDMMAASAAFARLPEEQRSLIALVVIDGRSYREAADTLQIPIGTVMSRIARARAALAAQINPLRHA